jgi:hypothetical protein
MTGMRRTILTAALFGAALVFLLVAILTHKAVPLFVMWLPLLTVPLVLGRRDPQVRPAEPERSPEADQDGPGSQRDEATETEH